MRITSIVEALVQCGATPEMILCAVRAAEAGQQSDIESRRASDRERQQRHRAHVTSRAVTATGGAPLSDKERSPHPLKKLTLPTTPKPSRKHAVCPVAGAPCAFPSNSSRTGILPPGWASARRRWRWSLKNSATTGRRNPDGTRPSSTGPPPGATGCAMPQGHARATGRRRSRAKATLPATSGNADKR